MTNDTVHTYTYDAEGRILTVDSTSGVYVYDAFGRRIEKTAGGTSLIYLYDLAGHEIAEINTSGTNIRDDIWAGSRHLAMYFNSSTYFFNSDQVGTERVATDPTGAIVQTCTNFQYGDDVTCSGSLPQGYFAGYETDNEFGLYHSQSRYYSPALGRFMSPDPMASSSSGPPSSAISNPQELHAYAYAVDSPATLVDPSGWAPRRRCANGTPLNGICAPLQPPPPMMGFTPWGGRLNYSALQIFALFIHEYVDHWRGLHPGSPFPANGFQLMCSDLASLGIGSIGSLPVQPGGCGALLAFSTSNPAPSVAFALEALEAAYGLPSGGGGMAGFFSGSPDLQLALSLYTGLLGPTSGLSGMNGNIGFAVDFGFPSFDFAMFFGGGGSSGNGCQIWDPCSM